MVSSDKESGGMLDINDMFRKAYNLLKEDGLIGIYLAKETELIIVCYGGNPDERYYGLRTVSVEKETGKCEWFDINVRREELKCSKDIGIPPEFINK